MTRVIGKKLEQNENENTCINRDTTKLLHRGKFVALNTYLRRKI